MSTRRQFIRNCSLLAAAAAVAPAAAVACNRFDTFSAAAAPGLAQFQSQVGTVFGVPVRTGLVTLVLTEAVAIAPNPADAPGHRSEKFSLLFRGPVAAPLGQDTHALDHDRLGRQEIFIVPIGHLDTTHRYYQAIFDRPLNSADLTAQLTRAPRRANT